MFSANSAQKIETIDQLRRLFMIKKNKTSRNKVIPKSPTQFIKLLASTDTY